MSQQTQDKLQLSNDCTAGRRAETHWCAAADCCQIIQIMLLFTPSDIVPSRFFLADLISIAAVLLHDTLLNIGSSASAAHRNIPVGVRHEICFVGNVCDLFRNNI